MNIYYLEIVTTDVNAACALYSQMHGVSFGEADQKLSCARTANLVSGGMLGIRAPLRDTEKPVVRPYVLVEDIKASIEAAAESGAQIAMPPTEIAGHGQFAIVIQCGIEFAIFPLSANFRECMITHNETQERELGERKAYHGTSMHR